MKKYLFGIGFLIAFLSIGFMDNESVLIPAVIMFAGLGIMYFSAKGEEINDTV